jgi:hypothetical protein
MTTCHHPPHVGSLAQTFGATICVTGALDMVDGVRGAEVCV